VCRVSVPAVESALRVCGVRIAGPAGRRQLGMRAYSGQRPCAPSRSTPPLHPQGGKKKNGISGSLFFSLKNWAHFFFPPTCGVEQRYPWGASLQWALQEDQVQELQAGLLRKCPSDPLPLHQVHGDTGGYPRLGTWSCEKAHGDQEAQGPRQDPRQQAPRRWRLRDPTAHRRGSFGQEKDVAFTRRREVCGLDLQHHATL
jgi:hypothetical protein